MANTENKFKFTFFYWAMAVIGIIGIILLLIDVPEHGDWSGGLSAIGIAVVLGIVGFVGDKLAGHQ
jgi:drug/metabolite transporter (DMT)-like permease